jgi:signal transduction histidine kinase
MMYGDRDEPGALLSRLGTRMQATMLPDDVPPAVVETVAQSLRLPYVAIDVADGSGQFRVAAEHGVPKGEMHIEPLTHRGTTVGRLRASDRGSDDPLNKSDLDLIRSLTREVGPAVEAVRLHRDLLQSRAEAVALREDERRRLRRDLHDGLGPTLAAIGLKAALAARDVPESSTAHALLGEIESEAKASVGDIRRLVDALRPPALDELGLIGALRSRAHSLAGQVSFDVSGNLEGAALPAAVETACYRIAVEAMTNTVRHSDSHRCSVRVATDDWDLTVVVRDDGHGLAAGHVPGVGLRSMQERAEEVGGSLVLESTAIGTTVTARLPLDLEASG